MYVCVTCGQMADMRDTDGKGMNLVRCVAKMLKRQQQSDLLSLQYDLPNLGTQYKGKSQSINQSLFNVKPYMQLIN